MTDFLTQRTYDALTAALDHMLDLKEDIPDLLGPEHPTLLDDAVKAYQAAIEAERRAGVLRDLVRASVRENRAAPKPSTKRELRPDDRVSWWNEEKRYERIGTVVPAVPIIGGDNLVCVRFDDHPTAIEGVHRDMLLIV